MARLAPMLLFIDVALLVVALLDCLSAQESGIRTLSRPTWIFLILLLSPIGGIAWFIAGQPAPPIRLANGTVLRPGRRSRTTPTRRAAGIGSATRIGPIGPEDDPDFIRTLQATLRSNESDPNR